MTIIRSINMFAQRARKTIKWLPIIWRTDVYDYAYLITLMQQQISDMADFFESENAATKSSTLHASRMRLWLELANRMNNEYYIVKAFDEIEDYNYTVAQHVKDQIVQDGIKSQEKCDRLVWRILEQNLKNWWD